MSPSRKTRRRSIRCRGRWPEWRGTGPGPEIGRSQTGPASPVRRAVSPRLVGLLGLSVFAAALGAGPSPHAVRSVREGIRQFSTGDFKAARSAFSAAADADPDEATIVFDRACAEAASAEYDKAHELFQQSSLARDIGLAVASHYNLGCLAAQQAKVTLGDDPTAASPTQRAQAMSHLLAAVGHYRDCLDLDPRHADARHNLELIRLFIKHIQSLWEQRDREQAHDDMDLLEFLSMIEQKQQSLRKATVQLNGPSDSPQRRQAADETEQGQRTLQEEIEPLQEKIRQLFASPAPSSPTGSSPGPTGADQAQQAEHLLLKLAAEAGDRMLKAAGQMDDGSFAAATQYQRDVLDRLHQIYMVVAPFPEVLQRAIREEKSLVGEAASRAGNDSPGSGGSEGAVLPPDPSADAAEPTAPPDAATADKDAAHAAPVGAKDPPDFAELSWQQSRVTDWSRMLTLKAQSQLAAMEEQPTARQQDHPAPNQSSAPDGTPPDAEPRAALRESWERATKLGPQAEQRSASAVNHLQDEDLAAALPDQQETLRLLQEIAEPLPSQDQQQDRPAQDNPDKNTDPDKSKDDNDQQQKEKEQQQQQQQQQQEAQSPKDASSQSPPSQASPQEAAMSILQRARERERRHRDLQKEMHRAMGVVVEVEKDW